MKKRRTPRQNRASLTLAILQSPPIVARGAAMRGASSEPRCKQASAAVAQVRSQANRQVGSTRGTSAVATRIEISLCAALTLALTSVGCACCLALASAQAAPPTGEPSVAPEPGQAAAGAQESTDDQDPGSDAPTLPPRALFVPPLAWPAALPLPDPPLVDALLVIGKDGRAQLEGCGEPDPVCDALAAALLEAEFAPASVAGESRAARVRVRFSVRASARTTDDSNASASPKATVSQPRALPTTPAPPPELAASAEFGAVGRVKAARPTAIALELEQMREVPGAFGDPFRVIDTLPGVVPVFTGIPYVYVRGAPPAATAYFFDDIQMPALFHLFLGPAVVHPAMVGDIDFYPGVAPARYGRKTGGTVAGQAAYRPLRPGVHGELELRLIDVQTYLATPLGDGGRLEVGGRYGYPALALKVFEPSATFQYWDYQARALIPVTRDTKLQVVALGSYDLVGQRTKDGFERGLELQFHRLELRAITQLRRGQVGYALGFGFERSGFGDDFEVTALRVGPKLWFDRRFRHAKVRLGADMLATSGVLGDPRNADDDPDDSPTISQNPIYRSASGRSVIGVYGEAVVPLAPRWELEAGLRGDLWITGGDTQQALEPRLLLRHQAHERVTVHAAFGLAYQPAVFLIPLPGVSDVALDRGLQRAIQQEVGTGVDLPASFRVETKLFLHLYDHMLSIDAIDEDDVDCAADAASECRQSDDFARMNAYAYGAELMIRRSYKELFSGWLAYTLSKADGHTASGRPLTPSFDVRHVANLVLQWRISRGFHAGLRGYAQSGRFPFAASTSADPRERERLPPFFRGDFQISRLWPRPWGELRFTFEWLNFTFLREPTGWKCPGGLGSTRTCKVVYSPFPITVPMLGVRGSY